ncbi:MAG: carbohydrate ABC transporter permease, partial [Desulfobacterales bacterium]
AIPFFLLARQFNALDKVSTLIVLNTTFNLPFAVIIMSQLFKELPIELEQAAMVDGYSRIGAFFKVALPLSAPGLVATGIICLAFAWNEFMFALIIAQRKAITLPYIISGASDTRGIQFWFIATRALMAMVPPTILALTVQKFIVRGLTFGAVKG